MKRDGIFLIAALSALGFWLVGDPTGIAAFFCGLFATAFVVAAGDY